MIKLLFLLLAMWFIVMMITAVDAETNPVERFRIETNCIDAECSNHHGKEWEDVKEHRESAQVPQTSSITTGK